MASAKRLTKAEVRSYLADLRNTTDVVEAAEKLSHREIGDRLYWEIRQAHEHGNAFMPEPHRQDPNPPTGDKAIRVYANQLPPRLVESEEPVVRQFATEVRRHIQGKQVTQRDGKNYVIDVRAITFEYMDRANTEVSIDIRYLLRRIDRQPTSPKRGEDGQ